MMAKTFFFAGGGTGGHIYPALAVAQKILEQMPDAKIVFFCSERPIDTVILSKQPYEYHILPATGFTKNPIGMVKCAINFFRSYLKAKHILSNAENPVLTGVGGFVSAPAVYAAKSLGISVSLINVDIVPGIANKLLKRHAQRVFVHFDETLGFFGKSAVKVGCPIREDFDDGAIVSSIDDLGIDKTKKLLLVTGASSGALTVNKAMVAIAGKLSRFADSWQIVHIAGMGKTADLQQVYDDAGISAKVLEFYHYMPSLLKSSDLILGRSGAISVAEYAASRVPAICMPYPFHKDNHQYLNASFLVAGGAGLIVDDKPEDLSGTAENLWKILLSLMSDDEKLGQMKKACLDLPLNTAARQIAEILIR